MHLLNLRFALYDSNWSSIIIIVNFVKNTLFILFLYFFINLDHLQLFTRFREGQNLIYFVIAKRVDIDLDKIIL